MSIAKRSLGFTLYLGGLGALPPLSIDMGLPALNSIAIALHSSDAAAALTLSLFLAGFAIAPIAGGPLSDRFGRRPLLLAGSALFALSGLGCTFAPTIEVLLLSRVLQGFGAGTATVLAMALVRDLFEADEARAKLSYVSILRSIGPMIAPTIGAWLLLFFDWRYIYGTLCIGGIILFIVTYFGIAESAPPDRIPLTVAALKDSYKMVLSHPVSFGYALLNALVFGSMFAYVSNSPLLIIGVFGLSHQQFGYLFAGTASGIMLGAFVNGRLSDRKVPHSVPLKIGLTVAVLATAINLAVTTCGAASALTLLPGLIAFTFSAGMIGPNASHGCLHPMPKIAGVAAAVLTFSQMVVGSLSSALVAYLYDERSAFAMTTVMLASSVCAALLYLLVVRPAEKKESIMALP
jgi:DHA1 family bicyclomycin/chloramphenicol resistance-like MFS transporter